MSGIPRPAEGMGDAEAGELAERSSRVGQLPKRMVRLGTGRGLTGPLLRLIMLRLELGEAVVADLGKEEVPAKLPEPGFGGSGIHAPCSLASSVSTLRWRILARNFALEISRRDLVAIKLSSEWGVNVRGNAASGPSAPASKRAVGVSTWLETEVGRSEAEMGAASGIVAISESRIGG